MSWEQLSTITADRQTEAERDKTVAPSACPNDGTPLVAGEGGVLHCPYDGWQWPRDARNREGYV